MVKEVKIRKHWFAGRGTDYMLRRLPDRAEWIAILTGLGLAFVLASILFSFIGWLGVGLVGLIGLVISYQISLHAGRAVPDADFGATGVGIVARQMEEDDKVPTEQRMAHRIEREKRRTVVYVVNTLCIGMAALGFGLFILHQLG